MTKKKLTISELIQQKEQLKRDSGKKKRKELYLDQLGATITIEEPEIALVSESIEMSGEDPGSGDPYLVYNIVVDPNLKDAELQKEYGCVEPVDIVRAIFDVGTVGGIAMEGLNLAGYNSKVTTVDKLKN